MIRFIFMKHMILLWQECNFWRKKLKIRVTLNLDSELVKKLHTLQAKAIRESKTSISFSFLVESYLLKAVKWGGLSEIFQSSRPNEPAKLENCSYDSKYCLPFGVITNVFFPSYSILFIRPAPVKFSTNFDNLVCERFAFVRRCVVLIPSWPDCSVATRRSATICMLDL